LKWITIETIDDGGKKTETFEVWSKYDACVLGIIKWRANWRKYAFFPYPQTSYEEDCMRDISDFIETKTKEYKRHWKKRGRKMNDGTRGYIIGFVFGYIACIGSIILTTI